VHRFAIYAAGFVVAGSLGVFVGNGYDGVIQRIDESTNTAGPEIDVARMSGDMVELNGSLWVVGNDASEVIQLAGGSKPMPPIAVGERTFGLATDGRALWLGTEGAHALRVDPTNGAVTRVALPAGIRATRVAADPLTGEVWATSMTPTPRLLRIPTGSPTATAVLPTTSRPTCSARDCPPPPPIPCPSDQTEPSMQTGSFCGPTPGPGNGLGPSGECSGKETAPPCGPGMIPDRYYEYTLPGRCDGKLILDGRRWLSMLPPTTNGPSMNVWVSVYHGSKSAGFISPAGAVGFDLDTGQTSANRSAGCQ
jgi:hypothetical protein